MHRLLLILIANVTTPRLLWLVLFISLAQPSIQAQFHLFDSSNNDECMQIVNANGKLILACNIRGQFELNGELVNSQGSHGFLLAFYETDGFSLIGFRFFESSSIVDLNALTNGDEDKLIISGRFFGEINWDGQEINTGISPSALFVAILNLDLLVVELKSIQGTGFKSIGNILFFEGDVFIIINFNQLIIFDTIELANVGIASSIIIKVDQQLEFIASHFISGSDVLQGNSMVEFQNSILLVGTYRGNFIHGLDTLPSLTSHSNAYILAFDLNLSPTWSQSLRGVFDDSALGIVANTDTYFVYGNYSGVLQLSPDVFIESTDNFTDVWMAAYQNIGQLVWHRTFNGTMQNQATAITLSGESIFLSGQYIQQVQSGDFSLSNQVPGNLPVFTARVNLQGNMVDLVSSEGNGTHFIFSLLLFDSTFCKAGAFYGVWHFDEQDFTGDQFAGFLQCRNTSFYTPIQSPISQKKEMRLWPVPVRDILYVEKEGFSIAEYVIFNTLGQVVKQGFCREELEQCSVNMLNLPSGVYYFKSVGVNFSAPVPFLKL